MGGRKIKFKINIPLQTGKSKYKKLKPYVDYYPLHIKSGYKKVKDQKTLEEMFYEDRILKTWDDLGEIAKVLYLGRGQSQSEALQEALKVLIKGANLFKSTSHQTFLLCNLLYNEINKKENKGKSFSKIVKQNLPQVASFMGTNPDNINPSVEDLKKLKIKYDRNKLDMNNFIKQVQLRYNRLVRDKKKEFEQLREDNAGKFFTYAAKKS